jgi:hypothetical protein
MEDQTNVGRWRWLSLLSGHKNQNRQFRDELTELQGCIYAFLRLMARSQAGKQGQINPSIDTTSGGFYHAPPLVNNGK